MLEPGARFGAFRLLSRLGRGGMGEVWRALKVGPSGYGWSRQVALKLILPTFAAQQRFREMFISEARIAAGLLHSNIVAVTDFGEEGEMLWLEQELVDGLHAGQILEHAPQGLPFALASYVTCEALKGLAYAHSHDGADGKPASVIHRDIKPSNLLVSREGTVKLTDFGIAKVLRENPSQTEVKGTVGYMAPELIEGGAPSVRSDLFAMGLVFWELLTGRRLFDGDNDAVRMFRTLECEVPPLDVVVPPAAEQILRRMLARRPEDRFAGSPDALTALLDLPDLKMATSLDLKKQLVALGISLASVSVPPLSEAPGLPTRTGNIAGELSLKTRFHRFFGWQGILAALAIAGVTTAGVLVVQRAMVRATPAALPAPPPAPIAAPPAVPLPDAAVAVTVAPPDAGLAASAPIIVDAGPTAAPAAAAKPSRARPPARKKKPALERDQVLEPE